MYFADDVGTSMFTLLDSFNGFIGVIVTFFVLLAIALGSYAVIMYFARKKLTKRDKPDNTLRLP